MSTPPLKTLIDQFADALAARGKNAQTVTNYRYYLTRFAQITGAREVTNISAESIGNFQTWLRQRRLKATTINYHGTALRSFIKWLQEQNLSHIPPRTVKLLPTPPRAVNALETPGLNRLLHFPLKVDGRAVLQYRDRAILEVLGSSGLRVGEISRLRREHLISDRGEIAVPGRGGKLRVVPLTQQARYWIGHYLKLRRDSAPQLFVRHDPASRRSGAHPTKRPLTPLQGLTPRSMQRLIKKYAHAAGLGRGIKPRTLRHTVAANLLSSGYDLETVRQRLGHQSLTTTKIYARPTRTRLKSG